MEIEIRAPRPDEFEQVCRVDGRVFGIDYTPEQLDLLRAHLDLRRFRVAFEGDTAVAVAGSYALDVTLPGGVTVPIGGVTWVGVSATHRRRGLLRTLMTAVHDDIDSRGEPLAALYASESAIYGRFGYGIGSHQLLADIDLALAQFRDDVVVDVDDVRYVYGDDARDHFESIYERCRRQRAGEVTRDAADWDLRFHFWDKPRAGASAAMHLIHPDGHAVYRMTIHSTDGRPRNRLNVLQMFAVTEDAYRALWHTLLNIDLAVTLETHVMPLDDPLPYLLTDRRAISARDVIDGLWVKVIDPAVCFATRTYGTVDRLVIESDGDRWAIDNTGQDAVCRKVRTRPDLVTNGASLGTLLMGAERIDRLVRAGMVVARTPEVARRAEHFFATERLPHSQTGF